MDEERQRFEQWYATHALNPCGFNLSLRCRRIQERSHIFDVKNSGAANAE